MHERIKQKLTSIEAAANRKNPVHNIIFYDPYVKDDSERRIKEFYNKHPDYSNDSSAVFLMPKKDDETLECAFDAVPRKKERVARQWIRHT